MISTLDLGFRNLPKAAGAFLLKCSDGDALIECGPSACWANLVSELHRHESSPEQIKHLFLTHIHLDHAGAAGLLAEQGTHVHVHPRGAAHLIDPSRLNASARRVFGTALDEDFGTMTACPEELVFSMESGSSVRFGDVNFTAMETTGHASHHHCWVVEEANGRHLFSGYAGGMRLPGTRFPTLPMVPPEFDLKRWRASIEIIRETDADTLWMTHFDEITQHHSFLDSVEQSLLEETQLICSLSETELHESIETYRAWHLQRATESDVNPELLRAYCDQTHYQANITGVRRWRDKGGALP